MTVLDYRSAPVADSTERTQGHWLGWAVYLAMSWTWCIGMFLPVLLVRDYGIWGFVVFAVPNVLGAAAMGWVLRSSTASAEITGAHRIACVFFSIVTVVFHVSFAVWVIADLTQPYFTSLGLFALAAFYAAARAGNRWSVWAAALVFVTSCTLFAWGVSIREMPYLRDARPRPLDDLWALASVSAFGFILCPYLDLTFHRARRHASVRESRLAHGIGFGVFFLVMMLFTLAYGGWLEQLMAQTSPLPAIVSGLIGFHLLVQSSQTTALHANEMANRPFIAVALFISILAVAVAPSWILPTRSWERGYEIGEIVYRCFMGFYALLFPAYVWLCMIPSPYMKPSRRSLLVFAVAVVIAAPMFWMGFIDGKMVWLLPGLAVVLLARLLVPRVGGQVRK